MSIIKAFIANYNPGTVSVIDTATNTVIQTIVVPFAYDIAVNIPKQKVYVPSLSANSVYVIDAVTGAILKIIPVGLLPQGIYIKNDGTKAYVVNTNSGTVSVIDCATDTVMATISGFAVGIYQICLLDNGLFGYVTDVGNATVTKFDATTNLIVGSPLSVGNHPDGIIATPDNLFVFVASEFDNTVYKIDANTLLVVSSMLVGNSPGFLTINAAGSILYVSSYNDNKVYVINVAFNSLLATISGFDRPRGMSLTPDEFKLYVTDVHLLGKVSVVDTVLNVISGPDITVGSLPYSQGRFIITVNDVIPIKPHKKCCDIYVDNNGNKYNLSRRCCGRKKTITPPPPPPPPPIV